MPGCSRASHGAGPSAQIRAALLLAARWGESHLCQVKAGHFINSLPSVSSPRAQGG